LLRLVRYEVSKLVNRLVLIVDKRKDALRALLVYFLDLHLRLPHVERVLFLIQLHFLIIVVIIKININITWYSIPQLIIYHLEQ
jgi:hypothetical protein